MYKDLDKKRQSDRERQRKRRDKGVTITPENLKDVTPTERVSRPVLGATYAFKPGYYFSHSLCMVCGCSVPKGDNCCHPCLKE